MTKHNPLAIHRSHHARVSAVAEGKRAITEAHEAAMREHKAKVAKAEAEHDQAHAALDAHAKEARDALASTIVESYRSRAAKPFASWRSTPTRELSAEIAALWRETAMACREQLGEDVSLWLLAGPLFELAIADNPSAIHMLVAGGLPIFIEQVAHCLAAVDSPIAFYGKFLQLEESIEHHTRGEKRDVLDHTRAVFKLQNTCATGRDHTLAREALDKVHDQARHRGEVVPVSPIMRLVQGHPAHRR